MSEDARNLSGAWDGIFNYPRDLPPGGFRANLVDHGGAISGETEERSDTGRDRGEIIIAWLEGNRSGDAVNFTKRYDDLTRAHYSVHYAGSITDDGNEICGRWDIPGEWSGTFIMTRRSNKQVAARRRTAETVR